MRHVLCPTATNTVFCYQGIARQRIEEIIETLGKAPYDLISTEPRHVVFTRLVKNSLSKCILQTMSIVYSEGVPDFTGFAPPTAAGRSIYAAYSSNDVCLSISLVAFSVAAFAFFAALLAAHTFTVFLCMGVIPFIEWQSKHVKVFLRRGVSTAGESRQTHFLDPVRAQRVAFHVSPTAFILISTLSQPLIYHHEPFHNCGLWIAPLSILFS